MRLFVAIDIPEQLKLELSLLRIHLKHARWTPPENMHITLKFLGEVRNYEYQEIVKRLEEIEHEPFSLVPKSVGYFAHRKTAKVLWAGLGPSADLESLALKIRKALTDFGEDPGQSFHPHITLARLDNVPVEQIVPFLQSYSLFSAASFPVESFSLYSSITTPRGSCYTKELQVDL
ncbi:MAG: RNA 2',3'-cyclic phosphodiesterase [Bdellovibrio sp.]|nr:RNA 2',3'-cyclic phosphodiesterase [Bdellovibrio sp.]